MADSVRVLPINARYARDRLADRARAIARRFATLVASRRHWLVSMLREIAKTTAHPKSVIDRIPVGKLLCVADLPGPRTVVYAAVSRAVGQGALVRARRGLYFKGTKTRYGMTLPSTEQLARAVLGTEGVGPASWTAARALELTTQVPTHLMLAVVARPPSPIEGVRIVRRSNEFRKALRYVELAALELPDMLARRRKSSEDVLICEYPRRGAERSAARDRP